jgi:sulfide dehydrogenase [flavocytochrome c] flavoprotein subunit
MLSRRHFIKLASSSAGLFVTACSVKPTKKNASARVVIIGGGFGGATAAKYIRKLDPTIQVTLIDSKSQYTTCPGSNWVFGGIQNIASLSLNYQSLSNHYGVNLVHQKVTSIDPEKHLVTLSDRQKIRYDRLIVSPGIDFRWDTIEGHNESSTDLIPHAWKAGSQTTLLNNQLRAMKNGGTVIICAPPNPFKCPPGPYERASMIAYYLKKHKPKSKILILDPKSKFSKQGLFIQGWEKHYRFGSNNSMIEWLSIPDNPVTNIDVSNKIVETDFGDKFKADVLNYIPAQKAAHIAEKTGLCDQSGWCPVTHNSSESTLLPDIHVIGDASNYSPLPKSAFAANSEAKVCAFAVVSLLNKHEMINPTWTNTCYSLITPEHGISVSMIYKLGKNGKLNKVKGAGGVTQNTDKKSLSLEANYSRQWLASITQDSFS